jgi:hypothetical protein
MAHLDYLGIDIVEGQEPTDKQIRTLMQLMNIDYYLAQEDLREISYGIPPHGYSTWAEYINRIK